jgi:PadR family transcriptional regulator, regulatory protein AphA
MAKSSKSRYAILGILTMIPKSSGYDIKKLMESSTQYFWKETFSSIYPVLQELEEQGLVLKSENPAKGDRQRNHYEITSEGLKALSEWLNKPAEEEQMRSELMLKLFFGSVASPKTSRQHIKEYQILLREKLSVYLQIKNNLTKEHIDDEGLPYWLMTLDLGLRQVQTALEWCEHTIKQMNILGIGD